MPKHHACYKGMLAIEISLGGLENPAGTGHVRGPGPLGQPPEASRITGASHQHFNNRTMPLAHMWKTACLYLNVGVLVWIWLGLIRIYTWYLCHGTLLPSLFLCPYGIQDMKSKTVPVSTGTDICACSMTHLCHYFSIHRNTDFGQEKKQS